MVPQACGGEYSIVSPRRINPVVDTFRGINNALNPCSAQYRQFMAFVCKNSRINESGLWDKAAALGNVVSGASQVDLPEGTGTHFKEVFIKGVQTIVGQLTPNSSIEVGPNKYAYFADPDVDSGVVSWWDGIGETEFTDWDKAGMGKPDADKIVAIASCSASTGTVTITTSTVHGRATNDYVTIEGTDNYDEVNVKVTVTNTTVFTYTSSSTGATSTGVMTAGMTVADNSGALEGGRMQRGTYYYMYTYFDTARQVESLPSTITDWVCAAWPGTSNSVDSAIYPTITINPDPTHVPSVGSKRIDATTRVRVYRTKRTYEPDRDINAPNEFFYIGDLAYSTTSMSIDDLAHDSELVDRYEGRGTPPPTGVDCMAGFENRMYYFVGNVVYWSSAGRPGEVAQDYTLTYETRDPAGGASLSSTFPAVPILAGSLPGEAKYEIVELAGQTVIGAYSYNGKLWVWTESVVGYLRLTLATEGVRFHRVRKGLGLISSKTLADTPHGLFGADREGVWLLDNNNALGRLSKGVIDIDDSTKTTYFLQSTLTASFGVWVPALDEYWWCAVNTGEAVVHRQLAYQPLRRLFGGVYEYSSLTGGCAMTTAGGAQSYLTGGKTPSATSVATDMQQQLDFWMGQHSLGSVKDKLKVEIIYESITANQTVTVALYQNNIASTTGAQPTTGISHSDANLVGAADAHGSGRMFLVRITTTNDATRAPIIAINYEANEILWGEKSTR